MPCNGTTCDESLITCGVYRHTHHDHMVCFLQSRLLFDVFNVLMPFWLCLLLAVSNVAVVWYRDREVREDRKRILGAVGMGHLASETDQHPGSTNLYVSNLFRTVNEDVLMETFGRYGPLASVKIMYPRGDEDRAPKTHFSGFVAFMVRSRLSLWK
jgi:hypothetical protein